MGFTAFRSRQHNPPVVAGTKAKGNRYTRKQLSKKRIATLEESVRTSSVKVAETERTSASDRELLAKVQNQLASMEEEARTLAFDLEKSRSQYVELASADQQKMRSL